LRPRRGPERAPAEPQTRINEAIRVPQVRLIDDDGEQIGIKSRDEALEYAWAKNLDLVEVAPEARPPVCRVMDYSKYKYEQEQKAKLARKHQSTITIKEIKLRPKVGQHDYETKKGHVARFLQNRDKVKVTIMFRGRETTHPERGRNLLLRLATELKEIGVIESEPLQDGRNMVMMLAPVKERIERPVGEGQRSDDDAARADAPPSAAPAAAASTAAAPAAADGARRRATPAAPAATPAAPAATPAAPGATVET
jgi:translation initiation factor IF-3